MSKYVLVEDDTNKILEEVEGDTEFRSGEPPLLPYKNFAWYSLVIVNPPFADATEVKEGPVTVFTSTEVTRTWTVRLKTEQELNTDKVQTVTSKMLVLKPLILALNAGSFVPGSNYTNTQIKTILKAHL